MTMKRISFSDKMIRALIREIKQPSTGKTMSRHVVEPQPPEGADTLRDIPRENRWWAAYGTKEFSGITYRPLGSDQQHPWRCPYGRIGDLICVSERFSLAFCDDPSADNSFIGAVAALLPGERSGQNERSEDGGIEYRATYDRGLGDDDAWFCADDMPRWASRLTLHLTGVRVERVQDITEADAQREGCGETVDYTRGRDFRTEFAELWDSANERHGYGWQSNPFVWTLAFRPSLANIDVVLANPKLYGIGG
jgi:hypothetical protein